jgi:hypothetical protein
MHLVTRIIGRIHICTWLAERLPGNMYAVSIDWEETGTQSGRVAGRKYVHALG